MDWRAAWDRKRAGEDASRTGVESVLLVMDAIRSHVVTYGSTYELPAKVVNTRWSQSDPDFSNRMQKVLDVASKEEADALLSVLKKGSFQELVLAIPNVRELQDLVKIKPDMFEKPECESAQALVVGIDRFPHPDDEQKVEQWYLDTNKKIFENEFMDSPFALHLMYQPGDAGVQEVVFDYAFKDGRRQQEGEDAAAKRPCQEQQEGEDAAAKRHCSLPASVMARRETTQA